VEARAAATGTERLDCGGRGCEWRWWRPRLVPAVEKLEPTMSTAGVRGAGARGVAWML
jgi:hypothetical protein